MTINESSLLKGAAKANNIFKSQMALMLIIIIVIIVLERYINRSDTKKNKNSEISKDEAPKTDNDTYFGEGNVFVP
jgi:ATP/ADP translocase